MKNCVNVVKSVSTKSDATCITECPLIVVTVIVYVIVLDCSLYSLCLLLSPCLDFLFRFVVHFSLFLSLLTLPVFDLSVNLPFHV